MLRKSMTDLEENGKKGDWVFFKNDELIAVRYGDDPFTGLVILPVSQNAGAGKAWNWNGNKENPTLTPSILVHPYPGWNDGWHGFLTDGKLITC